MSGMIAAGASPTPDWRLIMPPQIPYLERTWGQHKPRRERWE